MPKVYNGDLTKLFDLTGKKAVIFGGAGGFGQAIAEGYAANGWGLSKIVGCFVWK